MLTSLLIIPVLGVLALSPMNDLRAGDFEVSSKSPASVTNELEVPFSSVASDSGEASVAAPSQDSRVFAKNPGSRFVIEKENQMKNITLFVTVLTFLVSLLL